MATTDKPFEKELENLEKAVGPPVSQEQGEQSKAKNVGINFEMDRNFLQWFANNNISIIVTSYKTNVVLSIGSVTDEKTAENKLSIYMTQFSRPMGLHVKDDELWLSTQNILWKYVNNGKTDDTESEIKNLTYDATYYPRKGYVTNDIDVHDIVVDKNSQPYYISAKYSCLCRPSDKYSFDLQWKPKWISKVAREDRCHLNGVCLRDGTVRYVSAASQTDIRTGWKEKNRVGLGVVVDIETNDVVCDGLTMPHSPRWMNGKLWVLNSGSGEFGYVDMVERKFKPMAFIAGFLRGLDFYGKYAIIGSSMDRHEKTFMDLPLGKKLMELGGGKPENAIDAVCGIHVVDMETFDVVYEFKFTSAVVEIYDIAVLRGVKRPKIMGLYSDEEITNTHTLDPNMNKK